MPLDRRVRDEFQRVAASGPAGLDPAALESVVAATAVARRRRRDQRAGASLLAVLAVGALAFGLQRAASTGPVVPSPIGPPSASSSPAGTPVVSRVHAYHAVAPAGWTPTLGSRPWAGDAGAHDQGVADVFRSPDSPAVLLVASQVLPAGTTREKWLTDYLPGPGVSRPECFPASASAWSANPVTVDGRTGGQWGGEFGCSFTEVVVFSDTRAYVITGQPDPARVNTDIFDEGVIQNFLSSLHLDS